MATGLENEGRFGLGEGSLGDAASEQERRRRSLRAFLNADTSTRIKVISGREPGRITRFLDDFAESDEREASARAGRERFEANEALAGSAIEPSVAAPLTSLEPGSQFTDTGLFSPQGVDPDRATLLDQGIPLDQTESAVRGAGQVPAQPVPGVADDLSTGGSLAFSQSLLRPEDLRSLDDESFERVTGLPRARDTGGPGEIETRRLAPEQRLQRGGEPQTTSDGDPVFDFGGPVFADKATQESMEPLIARVAAANAELLARQDERFIRADNKEAPQGQPSKELEAARARFGRGGSGVGERPATGITDVVQNPTPIKGRKPSFDDVKLSVLNEHRQSLGLEPVFSVPGKERFGEFVGRDVLTGKGARKRIPFVGALDDGAGLLKVQQSAEAFAEDRETVQDVQNIVGFYESLVLESRGKTIPANVASILSDLVPFGAEFMVSGGAIPAAKATGKSVARRLVGDSLARKIGALVKKQVSRQARRRGAAGVASRLGLRTAGAAAGGAVRLPTFSARIAAGTIERMIPDFTLQPGDEKQIDFIIDPNRKGDDFSDALGKSVLDMYIEVFSEQTGKILGSIGKTSAKVAKGITPIRVASERVSGLKATLVGALMRGNPQRFATLQKATSFLRKAGYHGAIQEIGEERVGDLMRAAVGQGELGDVIPSGEQLAAEGIAFTTPAAGAAGVAALTSGRAQRLRPPEQPAERTDRPVPPGGPQEAAELGELVEGIQDQRRGPRVPVRESDLGPSPRGGLSQGQAQGSLVDRAAGLEDAGDRMDALGGLLGGGQLTGEALSRAQVQYRQAVDDVNAEARQSPAKKKAAPERSAQPENLGTNALLEREQQNPTGEGVASRFEPLARGDRKIVKQFTTGRARGDGTRRRVVKRGARSERAGQYLRDLGYTVEARDGKKGERVFTVSAGPVEGASGIAQQIEAINQEIQSGVAKGRRLRGLRRERAALERGEQPTQVEGVVRGQETQVPAAQAKGQKQAAGRVPPQRQQPVDRGAAEEAPQRVVERPGKGQEEVARPEGVAVADSRTGLSKEQAKIASPPRNSDPKLGGRFDSGNKGTDEIVEIWRTANATESDGVLHITIRREDGGRHTVTGREAEKLAQRITERPASEESGKATRQEKRVKAVEMVKRAIESGRPIEVRTQLRVTRLTKPEHIRLSKSGEVQTAERRTFVTLLDSQVDSLVKQAEGQPKTAKRADSAPSNPDIADRAKLANLQQKRSKTRGDEISIQRLFDRLNAKPDKFKVGDGVGRRVSPDQINRGFRVISVQPDAKTATIKQVADTGITVTGGDFDRIADETVHVADLVRDRKFNQPKGASDAKRPSGVQEVRRPVERTEEEVIPQKGPAQEKEEAGQEEAKDEVAAPPAGEQEEKKRAKQTESPAAAKVQDTAETPKAADTTEPGDRSGEVQPEGVRFQTVDEFLAGDKELVDLLKRKTERFTSNIIDSDGKVDREATDRRKELQFASSDFLRDFDEFEGHQREKVDDPIFEGKGQEWWRITRFEKPSEREPAERAIENLRAFANSPSQSSLNGAISSVEGLGASLVTSSEGRRLTKVVDDFFRKSSVAHVIDETTTLYVRKGHKGKLTIQTGDKRGTKGKDATVEQAVTALRKIQPPKTGRPVIRPSKGRRPSGSTSIRPVEGDKEQIETLFVAVAREPSRFAINGVAVEKNMAAATDGKRIHTLTFKSGHRLKEGLYGFGPKNTLGKRVAASGKTGGTTTYGKGEDAANFPDPNQVIPRFGGNQQFTLDIQEHRSHINRAATMADVESKGMILVANTNGSIGYATRSDQGQAEINVKDGGQPIIGVNPQFLSDALVFAARNGSSTVTMHFYDSAKPLKIVGDKPPGPTATAVIMPVNMGEVGFIEGPKTAEQRQAESARKAAEKKKATTKRSGDTGPAVLYGGFPISNVASATNQAVATAIRLANEQVAGWAIHNRWMRTTLITSRATLGGLTIGKTGKQLAHLVTNVFVRAKRAIGGPLHLMYDDAIRPLSRRKGERENLFMVLDGQQKPMNEKVAVAVKAMREFERYKSALAESAGLLFADGTRWRPLRNRIPQFMNDEVIKDWASKSGEFWREAIQIVADKFESSGLRFFGEEFRTNTPEHEKFTERRAKAGEALSDAENDATVARLEKRISGLDKKIQEEEKKWSKKLSNRTRAQVEKEAEEWLDRYRTANLSLSTLEPGKRVKIRTRIAKNVQLHRLIKWPRKFLMDDLASMYQRDLAGFIEKVAEAQVFRPDASKLHNSVNAFLSQVKKEAQVNGQDIEKAFKFADTFARTLIGREIGNPELDAVYQSVSEGKRKLLRYGQFLSAAMHLGPFSRFAMGGNATWGLFMSALRLSAFRTAFVGARNISIVTRDFPVVGKLLGVSRNKALRRAYASGALENPEITFMVGDAPLPSMLKEILIGFVNGTEAYVRTVASEVGVEVANNSTQRLNKIRERALNRGEDIRKPILKSRHFRHLGDVGLTSRQIFGASISGKMTPKMENQARQGSVGITQFFANPGDLPIDWSSPYGRAFTQFWPMAYRQTINSAGWVLRELGRERWFPLVKLILLGTAAGLTMDELGKILYGHDPGKEPKSRLLRVLNIMQNAVGFIDKPVRLAERGSVKGEIINTFTPVMLSDVDALITSSINVVKEAIKVARGEEADIAKAGRRLLATSATGTTLNTALTKVGLSKPRYWQRKAQYSPKSELFYVEGRKLERRLKDAKEELKKTGKISDENLLSEGEWEWLSWYRKQVRLINEGRRAADVGDEADKAFFNKEELKFYDEAVRELPSDGN